MSDSGETGPGLGSQIVGGPHVDASQPLTDCGLKEDVFSLASMSSAIAALGKMIPRIQRGDISEVLGGTWWHSVNHPAFAEHLGGTM